jgi:hypothetical protein
MEYDARCNFIDILAAGARRPDKLLINIGFAHAKRDHALTQLLFFFGRN